jgi:uncharacterized membrane protein YozB (DUF420 family)
MSGVVAVRRSEDGFFVIMAAVAVGVLFLGFAPSFYLKSVIQAPPPLSLLTTVHGVVFTVWMALFVTQATLIYTGRRALHRELGMLGALLFGAMLTLGYWTAITAGRLGHAPPGAPAPLAFMALPLIAITGTAVLVTLALVNRRRSDWHRRFMLAAMFSLTGPGTGRIAIAAGMPFQGTGLALGLAEFLLVVAMAYDYMTAKRVHPAYWYALGVLAVVHIGVVWAFASPAWLAFAEFLTQG